MTTLRKVKEAAKKLGAIVVDDKCGDSHECTIEAPPGYKWNDGPVHEFVDASYRPWKPDYANLLSRMACGMEKCEDPDCDWCRDNGLREE